MQSVKKDLRRPSFSLNLLKCQIKLNHLKVRLIKILANNVKNIIWNLNLIKEYVKNAGKSFKKIQSLIYKHLNYLKLANAKNAEPAVNFTHYKMDTAQIASPITVFTEPPCIT